MLGGFDSVPGAIVGGLLIGASSANLCGFYIDTAFQEISAYCTIILVLFVCIRPVRPPAGASGLDAAIRITWLHRWFAPVALTALLFLPLLTNSYVQYIVNQVVVYVIIAIGLNLLLGYAGQLACSRTRP